MIATVDRLNERRSPENVLSKRLFSLEDLMLYLSLGKSKAEEFGKSCGAARHIGRRCLYDRRVIDAALDEITE